ncbi:hypothetical protein [Blastococcus mobilis]|uniref:Uncharacterized protein n=1 Tax=Blastococcus mobilis TaxID=1938746 RepID=A0A238VFY6_9ACTN|nr:hypothetical protein [Blastococcus mobilis]SNR33074.1 hypothetical protein SAMN06272737_10387 [Blastococcus mobilis]
MADDTTPDTGGDLPPVSGETARTGWYRSPSGTIAHADGPDQKRAFADRGWDEISEDDAKTAIAEGVQLTVDRGDTKGTFDADAVNAAVANESTSRPRRRRA